METGSLNINDAEIAYKIINPATANAIFFIHGNSGSSAAWRKQVKSPLLAPYRLVTIDLPNHGNSSALDAGDDCSLPALAKIVAAAIAQLSNHQPYIICSVSLATNIVAEMPVSENEPNGLLFAGPCIVGEGFGMDKMMLPGADPTAIFADDVPDEAVIKYARTTSSSTDPQDLNYFLKDYRAVQGNFRSSLYATVAAGNFNDQVHLIQKMNCPVCIVFGKEEAIVNNDYLNGAPLDIWNQTIYKIPGASHLVHIDAPEAFNQLLAEFATAMFTANVV